MMAGMTPKDIASVTEVSDPRISPDRRTVAFVVTTVDAEANEYRSRIWLAALDGSEPTWPFTAGDTRDLAPRWSPDGRHLAHVAVRGKEGSQVRVLPVASGGEAVVCASPPDAVSELDWSPDGRTIAFVARDPDRDRYGEPGQPREEKDMPPRHVTHLFSRLNGENWVFDRPSRVLVRAGGRNGHRAGAHPRRVRGFAAGVVARLAADRLRLRPP